MGHQLVYVCSVLSLLSMFPFWSQAQISFLLGNVSYWSSGSTVKLPWWTYGFNAQDIFGVQVIFKRYGSSNVDGLAEGFGGGKLTSVKPSYTIEDQAILVFHNANSSHNGTYSLVITFKASAGGGQKRSDVVVIILEKPSVSVACVESPSYSCICKGVSGNPPPWATWLKDQRIVNGSGYLEKKLSLEDIRVNGKGEYTCNATSYNLTTTQTVEMAAPEVTSFKSNKEENISNLRDRVTITCDARGNPPPAYTISLNGSKVADEKVFVIPEVSWENAGNYTCLASNLFGNATSQSFYFNVAVGRISPTKNPSGETTSNGNRGETASENVHQSCAETEWYVIVVTLICGAIFGAIVMHLVTFCFRRRSKARHHPGSSNPRNVSETMKSQAENVSTYEELGLRNMNEGDNYQSLTKNSKIDPSKETYYENEQAPYQELNKIRGSVDDNYQALQRP